MQVQAALLVLRCFPSPTSGTRILVWANRCGARLAANLCTASLIERIVRQPLRFDVGPRFLDAPRRDGIVLVDLAMGTIDFHLSKVLSSISIPRRRRRSTTRFRSPGADEPVRRQLLRGKHEAGRGGRGAVPRFVVHGGHLMSCYIRQPSCSGAEAASAGHARGWIVTFVYRKCMTMPRTAATADLADCSDFCKY
jgi:hypothetical protein